ncbi:VWA domain-containing protein [Pseudoroseicyclus tamaricis]|uniref:VWA domain-containing protein n=1 Tax=Pseudoroseicyclus tamaricis TaxID=2705421 RepID=A0A6B2JWZ7_9RHOB|nr:VWA domain-containing protein [Pseudoroseicyclus tamaricis]NDV01189.1 VWA domain-containing protein [Pseudoroseicyclus tamaricis]
MLSFSAPLFLAVGLVAAGVLLLHAVRKRRAEVPSLLIWRRFALPEGSRQARRRWPPFSWPLVLQIAAVLLLATALAQPYLSRRAPAEHLVLVLDGSAQMAAESADGTPLFDAALAELRGDLERPGAVSPARLSAILAGPEPRLLAAAWPWRPEMAAPLLDGLTSAEAAADWAEVARMVQGVGGDAEGAEILLLSSGPVPEELAPFAPGLRRPPVTAAPRPAVTAEVTALNADAGRWRVTAEVTFPEGAGPTQLTLGYSDAPGVTPLPWAEIDVEPDDDGQDSVTRDLELPGPGILTVALAGGEEEHFTLGLPPPELPVLYLGPGEQPLLAALSAVPQVALYQAAELPEDLSAYALVIVDGVTVAREPEASTLWIGAAHAEGTPQPVAVEGPDPGDWSGTNPLGQALPWSDLSLSRAYAAPAMEGAEVIVSGSGVPLVELRSGATRADLRLAFDPADSSWPGTPEMALLAGALLQALDLPTREPGPACVVGQPCAAPLEGMEEATTGAPLAHEGHVPLSAGLFWDPSTEQILAINAPPADTPAGEAPPLEPASAALLPQGLAPWLIGLAAACILADSAYAVFTGRNRGQLPVLALLALALLVAGVLRLPAPEVSPRERLVLVTADGSLAPSSGLTGPDLSVVRAGPVPELAGSAVDPAAPEAGQAPLLHGTEALALAVASVPPGQSGRVLLTASLGQRPDLGEVAAATGGAALPVDYLRPERLAPDEVVLRRIETSRAALIGDRLRITGFVEAGQGTERRLRIFRDGAEIASQPVSLQPGTNRLEMVLPAQSEAEPALVEMLIEPEGADSPANNRAGRIVHPRPLRPVAVISPDPAHGEAFAALLAGAGLTVDVLAPDAAPDYVRGWLGYGTAVLLNTPAISLTSRKQEILEEAVREHGLGLLLLGGANSFGPGGYFETPLEDLSPLSAKVPRDAPEVAMMFVLDRSGSMQQAVGEGTRLDMAKRATLSAIELLNSESQVGIVVFDAEARTVLPMSDLDMGVAEAALTQVDPGGGTSIYPGLVAAWGQMGQAESAARHVIVMTDGLSQPGDWPGILGQMREAGVTVSGVAIGEGSDRTTVEEIAALGGGAAHVTRDFAALPSILSQEAMMFSSPVEEGARQPSWTDRSAPGADALPARLPPVTGYVLTTAKDEAEVAITVPDEEGEDAPLLAAWAYGTGQVLAFTSDATGPWTEDWHALHGYGGFWASAARGVQSPLPATGRILDASSDGERLTVSLTVLDENGEPESGLREAARVERPGGETDRLRLIEAQPGLYEGSLPLAAPGTYRASVGEGEAVAETAYHLSYAPAFTPPADLAAGEWLASATGGELTTVEEATEAGRGLRFGWAGAWRPWVIAGLVLFLAALLRRYIDWPGRANRTRMEGTQ